MDSFITEHGDTDVNRSGCIVACWFAFKGVLRPRAIRLEQKNLDFGAMARITREGGFFVRSHLRFPITVMKTLYLTRRPIDRVHRPPLCPSVSLLHRRFFDMWCQLLGLLDRLIHHPPQAVGYCVPRCHYQRSFFWKIGYRHRVGNYVLDHPVCSRLYLVEDKEDEGSHDC